MGGGVAPFTEGGGTGGARWTRPSPAAGHTLSPNVWLPRADALKGPVVLPAAVSSSPAVVWAVTVSLTPCLLAWNAPLSPRHAL